VSLYIVPIIFDQGIAVEFALYDLGESGQDGYALFDAHHLLDEVLLQLNHLLPQVFRFSGIQQN
jgi:hypothetical protein